MVIWWRLLNNLLKERFWLFLSNRIKDVNEQGAVLKNIWANSNIKEESTHEIFIQSYNYKCLSKIIINIYYRTSIFANFLVNHLYWLFHISIRLIPSVSIFILKMNYLRPIIDSQVFFDQSLTSTDQNQKSWNNYFYHYNWYII